MRLAPTTRGGCREARAEIDEPPRRRLETVSADRRSEDRGKRPARNRRGLRHGQLSDDSMLRSERHGMGHHDGSETNGTLASSAAAVAALMVRLVAGLDLPRELLFRTICVLGGGFVMFALTVHGAAAIMAGHAYRHRTGAP